MYTQTHTNIAPPTVLYKQTHEWVSVEGTKCKVGITDYAQGALEDVVYVHTDPH